ncbi:MAG: metallophosphoesterase [Candidatus Hodarchaeota archaeon]
MSLEGNKRILAADAYCIVAVTDVHLGYDKSDRDAFVAFIDFLMERGKSIENFVIMGDFLDLWTVDNKRLINKNKELLGKLSEMKEQGLIRNIHYVVGNHDFIIKSLEGEFEILAIFEFRKPESTEKDWLTLIPDAQRGSKKTFGFMHGHQLVEGQIGEAYDGLCVHLCKQGDLLGWLSRLLWSAKNWTPVIATIAMAYCIYQQIWIGALVAAIATIILAVWVLKSGPDLSEVSAESYRGQVDVLLRSLPWRERRKIIRYLKKSPEKRVQMTPPQIQREQRLHSKFQQKVPDFRQEEAFEIINRILQITPTRSSLLKTEIQAHTVVGHTHEPHSTNSYDNLGSWDKEEEHLCFIALDSGDSDVFKWKWKPPSRWRRFSRGAK